MNKFEMVLKLLEFKMEIPANYGWFHVLSLMVMAGLIILLAYKKPCSKRVLLLSSIIMLVFEAYKQITFSFHYDGNIVTWSYEWYAFPFQFCSTPMYVALIGGLTRSKKLESISYAFLATYGLVGGIAVMLYPNTVFVSEVLIDVQTMIHHGLMVVMGSYLIISKSVKLNFRTALNAFKVFIALTIIALAIDISTYYVGIDNGLEMFFISPFHVSTLPVFSIIYSKVPYIIFLLIYIIVFTLGACVTLLGKNNIKNSLSKRKKMHNLIKVSDKTYKSIKREEGR